MGAKGEFETKESLKAFYFKAMKSVMTNSSLNQQHYIKVTQYLLLFLPNLRIHGFDFACFSPGPALVISQKCRNKDKISEFTCVIL